MVTALALPEDEINYRPYVHGGIWFASKCICDGDTGIQQGAGLTPVVFLCVISLALTLSVMEIP